VSREPLAVVVVQSPASATNPIVNPIQTTT
jgi:hypothetical protein